MLGIIDDFVFEMSKAGFDKIKQQFKFGWSKKDRLYNNPIHQKRGKYEQGLTISGTLVLESVNALDRLISIGKSQRPVTLVLSGIDEVCRVVILSIDIDRDIFLQTGEEIRKKFSMKVDEYYGA